MTSPARHTAALSLGGNMGDVAGAFEGALAQFAARDDTRLVALSSVWRTPPWGKTDQPDFLNMAVLIATALTPYRLLDVCQELEQAAGRERRERWGPRTLDLDIITYDALACSDPRLTLPHPRAHERAFVLVPLAEIAPDLCLGEQTASVLAAQSDRAGMTQDTAASARLRNVLRDV